MKILLTSLLIFISFSSNAFTGSELYGYFEEHNAVDPTWKEGIYQGYVKGVTDAYYEAGLFCNPNGVTNLQAFDIVGKYLKDNPETRHKNAPSLVYKSLTDAYPCKKE